MLAPFNDYFYVKTDYPDPLNIRFVDKNSKYANRDGKVNLKDLVLLRRYLNKWQVETDVSVCDLNGDGSVNLKDLVLLQRHLNKWNVTLG